MRCPFCSNEDTQVKDSRPADDNSSIRRRRQCSVCGARFTTFERVQLRELVVIKRNGEKSIYDRNKVENSMRLALRKRKISEDVIDRAVNGISRSLEANGDAEISSSLNGLFKKWDVNLIEINYKPSLVLSKSHLIKLPKINFGSYEVRWRAMGEDGHVLKGVLTFEVKGK